MGEIESFLKNPFRLRSVPEPKPLHPLEEGAEFKAIIEQTGRDAHDIAMALQVSPSYVYQRLRLLCLTEEALSAYREGNICFAIALEIAQLPTHTQTMALMRAVTRQPSVRLFRRLLEVS